MAHRNGCLFDSVRRVLIVDKLDDKQTTWIAAVPWHVVVSFDPNDELKQAISQVAGVSVKDMELTACTKSDTARPSAEVFRDVAKGHARLFLTVPAGPMNFQTQRMNLQAFKHICDELDDIINPDRTHAAGHVAVLNEHPVADTTTKDLWVRMLQHSSAKTVLVGVSQDNSADDVWRACNDRFVNIVHFACTDAVFPTLADMLGSATNENVIELPTTGTILNEELGQVSGLLSLLYAPSYHGRNWDRALRDVQLEFLQGGALTADLLVREREEGAASCVVRRRRLNDALARELSAAVAGGGSSGSGKSSHRVIVVHHERMTGASTAVRHVLLEKAMARSVTALEVTKLPTDSNDVRKREAFLQLVHERSDGAAVVCLVDSDNITHDAVHRLMQSTGIGDIPNVCVCCHHEAEARPAPPARRRA